MKKIAVLDRKLPVYIDFLKEYYSLEFRDVFRSDEERLDADAPKAIIAEPEQYVVAYPFLRALLEKKKKQGVPILIYSTEEEKFINDKGDGDFGLEKGIHYDVYLRKMETKFEDLKKTLDKLVK